ncbi:MAG TPA: glycosyltransferase family 2 protein [bacterium]|nr:glycosyltransferase family 2 protein [bacterium]
MKPAPVAVVIVNYNRAELLRQCIASVLAQTVPPAEIIVVDNGSSDGSAEMVERSFGAAVRVIRLERNQGFAGGNNAGIAAASSEWIALLNNDATADPGWIAGMMEAAERDAGAGLVACRILRADRRELLDNIGVRIWADGISRGARHFSRDAETDAAEVFIPSGCAMMMKRGAFVKAGGFDEGMFCYSEDTDLFIRIRLLGFRCVMARRAAVYHLGGGGTLGVVSPEKIYLVERNRIAILMRYYPIILIILSPAATAWRYIALLLALMRGLAARRRTMKNDLGPGGGRLRLLWRCAGSLFRAYGSGLRRLPADLRVRGEWRGKSRLPAGAMAIFIRKYYLDMESLAELEPR